MWALSSGCGTSWLSLFLAAQVLSSCFFVAHSQDAGNVTIRIELLPKYPKVGDSVKLIPELTDWAVTSCLWLRSFGTHNYRIFLHEFQPNDKITKGDGHDGKQFLLQYCDLLITKLNMRDMGFYKIIKTTTGETEIGEAFLQILEDTEVVTPSLDPPKRKERVDTVVTVAGILVGCLIGAVLVVSLISCQITKQPEGLGSGEGRSPHSSSKPGSQPRLSIHTLGPGPAPQSQQRLSIHSLGPVPTYT
ncbi:uncharacterized protein LOC100558043 isoform X5 [Anolis carolinensis]|uniref:uncharacterized protein LOC100558043 isoform X5 n=1 Tax=Anolis carolinensis TaxID=28377 RepID=UPI002F2B471F